MSTPLYNALKQYAAQAPARFHMPGHKGAFLPAPELAGLAAIDVTEIPGTGNLYAPGEPFDSAQALWAEVFGFDHCQFLTGGSTMGIHTGLTLCCPTGSQVLVDRGGSVMILEKDCSGSKLYEETKKLLADQERRAAMRKALLDWSVPDSAEQILDCIYKLARK